MTGTPSCAPAPSGSAPAPSAPLGFAILGCGMVAKLHASALARVQGARLVTAWSRSPATAQAFAAEHGIGASTGTLEEALDRPDIQVVCLTTPSGLHLDGALAAIRAGKHLVIEKPLEITVGRVDRILAAAREAGVTVAAIYQARFGPGARALKAAAAAGRFGRLVLCSVYIKWQRAPGYYAGTWHGTLALDGGGVLINQGIHGIDLLQWIAGMPVEVSAATTRRVHTGIEAEDTAAAVLRFPDGALGVIEASTAVHPGFRRRIEICGSGGSAVLEDDQVTRWEFLNPESGDGAMVAATSGQGMRAGTASPGAISDEGHRLQLQDMVDALRSGRGPVVPGSDARAAVSLVRAIYDSAALGRPVRPE